MSDQDPATEQWRKAMERSTGARLREALEANDALAKEHSRCVIEVERLRAALADVESHRKLAAGRITRLEAELGSALSALNRAYEQTNKEQP
jgi:hypothetical protein